MELEMAGIVTELSPRLSTGVVGLDEVLRGGFLPGRAYLARGGPGAGKTVLGLHFLTAGVANGERSLFITLEEPEQQIRRDASGFGLDLGEVRFLDLSPTPEFFAKSQAYDIFSPAEVEREPTTQRIVEMVEAYRPQRVFLEAMTQFRYLSPDAFQFHKQVLSFLRYLMDRGATVLFSSEGSVMAPDEDLQFVSDGVIHLEYRPEYSPKGRSVTVTKFRGSDFQPGRHSMRLTGQGMAVYPRLLPERHRRAFTAERVSSGVVELDRLLGGGLERGTVTTLTGPTGVGKTTVGLCFAKEAAMRGERSVVYSFEEPVETIRLRSEQIQIPVRQMAEKGVLSLVQVEPLRYTPDEFAQQVRQEVEERGARIVMLDSIAGYRLCIEEDELAGHLYALCSYLRNMGVTVLLVNEMEAITGEFRATELGISYLADNVVFMRYLEVRGELQKAIGVLKKRISDFEKSLRQLRITREGVLVGEPLADVQGVLVGHPRFAKNHGGANRQ